MLGVEAFLRFFQYMYRVRTDAFDMVTLEGTARNNHEKIPRRQETVIVSSYRKEDCRQERK